MLLSPADRGRVALALLALTLGGACEADRAGPAASALDAGPTGDAAAEALAEPPCERPADGVPPLGYAVGDLLASLPLLDCDGQPVDLAGFCDARAVWVLVAHGWCPHCLAVSAEMERLAGEHAAAGLVAVNVLVETGGFDPPGPADCAAWRDRHRFERVVALHDPGFSSRVLLDQPLTTLSVLVGADGVVREKLYTDVEAELRDALDRVLALP